MSNPTTRPLLAVCIDNDSSDDLTAGMLYRVLPDELAAGEDLLRVIDDSGDDYLCPAGRFVIVAVPRAEESKLLAVAPANVA